MKDLLASISSSDEPTRRCPPCHALVHQRDKQGQCPAYGDILLSLAGAVGHSTPAAETEAVS